ncbi:MAG: dioxygenase [Patescibacteria group bacterium]
MNKLPVLFLSHGSPMMALASPENDPYVAVLQDLGKNLPKPRAILAISAHWYVRGDFVDVSAYPQTIYDFGGFPDALYQMRYPAPGFPE